MSYFFQLKDISNQDTFSFSLPSYHFAHNLSDNNGSILKKLGELTVYERQYLGTI